MAHNYEESLLALRIGRSLSMYIYNEQYYASMEDVVWHGLFGFCTCGNPDVHLETLLNTIQKIEAFHHTDISQEFTGEEELWLYLLDKHGFTSHGCSVRCPWMNEDGEHLKCVLEVWKKNRKEKKL